MIQSSYTSTAYGYGQAVPVMSTGKSNRGKHTEKSDRELYGTSLLGKLDQRGYDAFLRATSHLGKEDTKLAAQTLEKRAAISAANQYASDHDIKLTSDMDTVYDFFEAYQDVVSTEQIKHLLNSQLVDAPVVEGKQFNSEQFFDDYLNQLGGGRALDITV